MPTPLFDPRPFAWLRAELEATIRRCVDALAAYRLGGDPAQLSAATTALSSCRGALFITGLEGHARFVQELIATLDAADQFAPALELAGTGLTALLAALRRRNPTPEDALTLLAQSRELRNLRGAARGAEIDLFTPVCVTQLDPPTAAAPEVAAEAAQRRRDFEQALLAYLRSSADQAALSHMRQPLEQLYQSSAEPLWYFAAAVVTSLQAKALTADEALRAFFTRLSSELRKYAQAQAIEPRVRREAVFHLARARPGVAQVDAIKAEFALAVPSAGPATQISVAPLPAWREVVASAEQALSEFADGATTDLGEPRQNLQQLSAALKDSGHTLLAACTQAAATCVARLAGGGAPAQVSTLAAVALILLRHGCEQSYAVCPEFWDDIRNLYKVVSRGGQLGGLRGLRLDLMRVARCHAVGEMRRALTEIELVLEALIAGGSSGAAPHWVTLGRAFAALRGVFALLDENAAAERLQQVEREVERIFAHGGGAAAEIEQLAAAITAIGFFVDSIGYDLPDHHWLNGTPKPRRGFYRLDRHREATSLPPPACSPNPNHAATAGGDQAADAELAQVFINEAGDVLRAVEGDLTRLATAPETAAAQDVLREIRRGYHTLKGSSRMVGLETYGACAAQVEDLLNRLLALAAPVDAPLLDALARLTPLFRSWVDELARSGRSNAAPDAVRNILGAIESVAPAQSKAAQQTIAITPPIAPEPASAEIAKDATDSAPAFASAPSTPVDPLRAAEHELPPAADTEPACDADSESSVSIGQVTVPVEVFDVFLREAHERVNQMLLATSPEHAPDFGGDSVAAAHTLAGIAAVSGFSALAELAGVLEELLHALSLNAGQPDGRRDLAHCMAERCAAMLLAIERGQEPERPLDLLEQVCLNVASVEMVAVPAPESMEVLASESTAEATAGADDEEYCERRVNRFEDEIDAQLLPLFLEEAQELLPQIEAEMRRWLTTPRDAEAARALTRHLHTFKGSARMAGAMALGQLVHDIETRVDLAGGLSVMPPSLLEELDTSARRIGVLMDALRRDGRSDVEAAHGASHAGDAAWQNKRPQVKIATEVFDRFVNRSGEIGVARGRVETGLHSARAAVTELSDNVARLRKQLRDIEIEAETAIVSHDGPLTPGSTQFDPLQFDRYTRFQELTRMMAESVSDVATVQTNLARHVEHAEQALIAQGRLSRALQQELVRVRTVPLGSVSARLYRVVRQTAKELGKKANLDIRGAQVEVDRTVLERLVGPIEHMIRNSIAHGLEDKARRNALGKAEIGELQLEARYEGNEIVIELADDGAGIHLERVRKRALERGLLAIGAEPSDAELAEFIFMPGFSTASEVTEIAGRGVGMDVVRAEVASLGGRLELSFERDRGTRFCISLPLTLAVTHVVLARAGSQLFAFPAATVEQIGQIRRDDLRAWRAAGTCAWAGRQYPFHHLAEVLSCGPATAEERSAPVLLLRCGAQRLAVQVDEIRGNVEVVMKPLGPQMQAIEGLAGATVLGDGSVVLVLHPAGMARRLSAAPRTAAVAAPAESADAPPAQILVVDDSVTVRKVTSRLLEREGYRVDTAKDGVEALQKIGRERPDVLLVDIEMPRMDGFDLTRHLRADRRFAGLPIIMITSRNADKHHKHALDLGVSVFLGKPYEENTLLECVAAFSATRH